MFICQECKTVSAPGAKPTKKVIKTRPKTYTNYTTGEMGRLIFGKQGAGTEIVQEITICPSCNEMETNRASAQKESILNAD